MVTFFPRCPVPVALLPPRPMPAITLSACTALCPFISYFGQRKPIHAQGAQVPVQGCKAGAIRSETRGKPSAQDTGTFVGLDKLAVRFGDLARSLQLEDDPDRTLEQIVQAAIEMIPGCDEGSISVVLGRRKVSSRASSSDLPRIVDAVQEETGQGPCMDAVYEQLTVRVADMASEQRWPRFTARALEAGAAGRSSSTWRAATSVR